MGILSRLADALRPTETRASGRYSDGWQASALGGYGAGGAGFVAPQMAESLAAVYAAVTRIGSSLGSLPALVYRDDAAGRVEMHGTFANRLVKAPNASQTWPAFMAWVFAELLLGGNALAEIVLDGAGRPVALQPIPWRMVTPLILPNGRLVYDCHDGRGGARRLLDTDCFHLRDRTDHGGIGADGLIGVPRLHRCGAVLLNALALQRWSSATWEQGAAASAVVSHPGQLSRDAFENLRDALNERYAGAKNAGKTVLLQEGMSWTAISATPADAQALESRKWGVSEIARVFGIPPPLLEDYSNSTFTNAAQASLWYAELTLKPLARAFEAELSRSVFGVSSSYSVTIDLSDLTRGDWLARWQAWNLAVQSGALDAADVREAEGWGPRPLPTGQQSATVVSG